MNENTLPYYCVPNDHFLPAALPKDVCWEGKVEAKQWYIATFSLCHVEELCYGSAGVVSSISVMFYVHSLYIGGEHLQ